jgi:hypothetical protein
MKKPHCRKEWRKAWKRAYVANNKILIRDTSVPIEEGDQIIRNLPNGITEVYKVIESIFFNRTVGGTQPFYNLNVRKVSESDKELKVNGNLRHIIHITGNNSHVNINSKDNSININMNSINYESVINELKNTW